MKHFVSLTDSRTILKSGFIEVFFCIAFLYLGFQWTLHLLNYRRKRSMWSAVPSAPEENWLLGHALPLAKSHTPWHVLNGWLDASGSPIVRFRILGKLAVILNDPLSMKRVFHTHMKAYPKDTAFSYGPFLSILGTGLVTSDGPSWQKQRLLIAPAMKIDALERVIPVTIGALERLKTKLSTLKGTAHGVDMASEFRHLTLQVIGEAVLSLEAKECDNVLAKNYLPTMEECNRRVIHRWKMYLPTVSWFQQEHRLWILNDFIKNILRKRWNERDSGDEPTDLLDKMLIALKEQGETWTRALEEQLCYEIKTFLLAGHETSAAMLAWALYELLLEPEYLKRVRQEADMLFATNDQIPKREDVEKMEFTLCVLKEALRKYTVVPNVVRVLSLEQDELCGYKIPKDTMIILSLKARP
eukprot:g5869.t1